jgi:hypothetical protein
MPCSQRSGRLSGNPFVDVAEHDHPLFGRNGVQQTQHAAHLVAPLRRSQAQVGDDHAHALSGDIERHVERAARLARLVA